MSEGFAEAEHGRLWFETAGDGPAIVFLHPGLWDSRTWDGQLEVFSKRYRVVRYDARGYGRSSRPEPGIPYSHVDDLVAVMDAVEVDRAALVGCSMGASTAIDAALTHPARVTGLALAGSGINGDFDVTPGEEAELEWLNAPVEEAMNRRDLEQAEDARLRIWAPLGTDDPAGARIREIAFGNLHELTMDESGKRDIWPPAADRLEEVAAPCLVLPADRDPTVYRRLSAILAERIPNARLLQIAETDHVVNMRRPAEFNRVVIEFLGEVLAGIR